MKTAVLEFQRNRVKRQPPEAASVDVVKTIAELRSVLRCVEKAILAIEGLAVAQSEQDTPAQRKSAWSKKRRSSIAKRNLRVIALPRLPKTREPEHPTPDVADPRYLTIGS
jgi:hypothetical protein